MPEDQMGLVRESFVQALTIKDILTASVIGAFVSTFGTLIALYLKDVLAVRSFERWKARQTLIGIYRRYRMPIFLAAEEFSGRLHGIAKSEVPARGYGVQLLKAQTKRDPNAMAGEHYKQYRFVSHTYRLCSFLAWVEMYRRDIGTLDVEALDRNHRLESCLENVRSAIADGWVNSHSDIDAWRDCLIFREELRAIGFKMTEGQKDLAILDFGSFSEILQSDPDGDGRARWFYQAALFFDDLQPNKDFRVIRMRLLVVMLTDLMEVLEPGRLPRAYIETALKWFDDIDSATGGRQWRRVGDKDGVKKRLRIAMRA